MILSLRSLLAATLLSAAALCSAEDRAWREMPDYLKGYEKEYAESPRKAALAWFREARFGLFIHWGPSSGQGRGMWAMYNERIPIEAYERLAHDFKGERFDAQAFVDLALKSKMEIHHLRHQTPRWFRVVGQRGFHL